ncbi:MAG: GNAT family N-acetyltransferase [Planctomycetota bacterium]
MDAISIEILSPDRFEEYGRFLLSAPRHLIYASLPYMSFLSRVVPGQARYYLATQGNAIVGAMPAFEMVHPRLGYVSNSLPWYGSHGGILAFQEPVVAALADAFLRHIRSQNLLSATIIGSLFDDENNAALLKRHLDVFTTDSRIGQLTSLPEAGEDIGDRLLQDVFTQKTRNLVRKSFAQGFEMSRADDDASWNFLFQTHRENLTTIGGRYKPQEHFLAIRETFPPDMRTLWIASHQGRPVAALLLLLYNRTVEYFTPAVSHEYRSRQPLSFLIHHAMIDAVKNGFQRWNWGGTWLNQKSLYHFKKGLGARDYPYRYYIITNPAGLSRMKENKNLLLDAFPNYYLFPLNQLT